MRFLDPIFTWKSTVMTMAFRDINKWNEVQIHAMLWFLLELFTKHLSRVFSSVLFRNPNTRWLRCEHYAIFSQYIFFMLSDDSVLVNNSWRQSAKTRKFEFLAFHSKSVLQLFFHELNQNMLYILLLLWVTSWELFLSSMNAVSIEGLINS